ncbi:hypothetical protein [Sedimentisphaera salicampi]|uniref:Uncharacterized protein n=1 Tax=Sedimentisphaera salicampi TaxID=1941349 RepID=A0A1W6LQ95_9BACT|nr:hypothetical protein [Sedimentisphaera salicampi]ARN57950.1 hypothetical protein STSP1_02376 [Sedimentisphaera salicampi]OXU14118.1 hypothetical protein SMSP1_02280 [Sedimentisphaera salicampi]
MNDRVRMMRVSFLLVVSLTIGTLALLFMDTSSDKPIEFSGYSLKAHTSGVSAIKSGDVLSLARGVKPARWSEVDVEFTATRSGDLSLVAEMNGCASDEQLNYHFVICNNLGDTPDGLIQPTHRWKNQKPCLPDHSWAGEKSTVRVCVIGKKEASMTPKQKKSLENLKKGLSEGFNVR